MNPETALQNNLDLIELPFYYLGLNTMLKRFCAGTFGVGAALFFFKPSGLFYEDGEPKPWSLTSSDEESVLIPWWGYAVGTGIVMATFV